MARGPGLRFSSHPGRVCGLAVVAFAAYERRHPTPMIDVRLFKSASFSTVMLVATAAMFGFTGHALIAVLYVQHVQDATPLGAAVRSLVMFVPFILGSAVAGKIVKPIGFRPPSVSGSSSWEPASSASWLPRRPRASLGSGLDSWSSGSAAECWSPPRPPLPSPASPMSKLAWSGPWSTCSASSATCRLWLSYPEGTFHVRTPNQPNPMAHVPGQRAQ